jgi:2-polyprenyl-6-methoxyphenol hydroxylase-like FAD-dependent oxidoreductase
MSGCHNDRERQWSDAAWSGGMGRSLQIAIVGAGPAGLAAALLLRRAGHMVTVFERFETPRPVGSGLILQPTGLTVLHHLGLFDAITLLGSRIDRLLGSDARSGRTVLDVRYAAQRKGRFGLAVHRAALFGVLYEAALAEGIAIETGVGIDGLDVSGGGAWLMADAGRRVGPFDLAVDASGSRSRLKMLAPGAREPRALAYGAWWASLNWRGEGFDAHALTQRYRRASVMIGVMPIGRATVDGMEQAAFFWSLKPEDAAAAEAAGLDAWKDRVRALWPETNAYLEQVERFDQLTLARYGHHTLPLPAGRNLAVIGDAAHSTSPQLGQGANMALLDAAALAHAVETQPDIEAALDAYCRARRWHVRVFQMLSLAFTPFYQSDGAMLPFARDRLVATIAKIPPGPQLLASMVAGTVIDPFGRTGLAEVDWASLDVA